MCLGFVVSLIRNLEVAESCSSDDQKARVTGKGVRPKFVLQF